MANHKTKLELTWVGKDERVRLERRVLVEDSSKSYGDPNVENMLKEGWEVKDLYTIIPLRASITEIPNRGA